MQVTRLRCGNTAQYQGDREPTCGCARCAGVWFHMLERANPPFTMKMLQTRLDLIGRLVRSDDEEAATAVEFELHKAVLEHIASGKCKSPDSFAREAAKSSKIEFRRIFS